MGEQNFERAVRVLEPLELTPETEAQWMELSELALNNNQVWLMGRALPVVAWVGAAAMRTTYLVLGEIDMSYRCLSHRRAAGPPGRS